MKNNFVRSVLQGFGFVISLYVFLFWGVFLFNSPIVLSGYSPEQDNLIFPVLMIIASSLIVWALIRIKPKTLIIFSFFSFFPVGFYFIGGNTFFSISIGVAYICLFLIGTFLFATQ